MSKRLGFRPVCHSAGTTPPSTHVVFCLFFLLTVIDADLKKSSTGKNLKCSASLSCHFQCDSRKQCFTYGFLVSTSASTSCQILAIAFLIYYGLTSFSTSPLHTFDKLWKLFKLNITGTFAHVNCSIVSISEPLLHFLTQIFCVQLSSSEPKLFLSSWLSFWCRFWFPSNSRASPS